MKYGKIYTFKDVEEAKKLKGKRVAFSNSLGKITEHPEVCERFKLQDVSTYEDFYSEEANYFIAENDDSYQFIRELSAGNALTPEEFANAMKKLEREVGDVYECHECMDKLMCDVLESLGYSEGIYIFDSLYKLYE